MAVVYMADVLFLVFLYITFQPFYFTSFDLGSLIDALILHLTSLNVKCVFMTQRSSFIGLVLGPFTAFYRSFLSRCTLTNKAVGLYDGPCLNLLGGDRVLILVPSDC